MNKRTRNTLMIVTVAILLIGIFIIYHLVAPRQSEPIFGKNYSISEYLYAIEKFNISPVIGFCDDMPSDGNHLTFIREVNRSNCISWDKRELNYYLACVTKNGTEVIDRCGSLSIPIK